MKLAALLLALSTTAANACTPMPATYAPDKPGSVAWARHTRTEAYIQTRLVERAFATIGIGDSIMGMWPSELLEAKWGGPVLNAGRGGSTTLHWLEWLDTWDWALQSPAVIHIHIGRNDITLGSCPAAIAQSVLAVIAKVKAKWPAARIVWQSIPPGGEWLRLKAFEVREVNRLVIEQATTQGFQVLDAWPIIRNWCQGVRSCGAFYAGDAYGGGPIHLGPNAYEVIYREGRVLP